MELLVDDGQPEEHGRLTLMGDAEGGRTHRAPVSAPVETPVREVRLGPRAVALHFGDGPHRFGTAARTISRMPSGYVALLTHDGAPGVVEEDGRRTVVQPGTLTFHDVKRPETWSFSGAGRSDLLLVERDAIGTGTRPLGALTPQTLPADRGTAAVVKSVLTGLATRLAGSSPTAADRIGSCLIDLAGALLHECTDEPTTARPESDLFARITSDLEHRLHDPELCPEQVAEAHHISVRYLSKLFAAEGTTVMSWVRERRLERCRADLIDRRLRNRSIAAVAARWGLLQPAHFSRAFRARYGMSPREYRLAARTPVIASDAHRYLATAQGSVSCRRRGRYRGR